MTTIDFQGASLEQIGTTVTGTIQIGTGTTVTGVNSVVLGTNAKGGSVGGDVIIGPDANPNISNGYQNVCIGLRAGKTNISGDRNVCIGRDTTLGTNSNDAVVVGNETISTANFVVATGFQANAAGTNAVAIGRNSFATSPSAIAIGNVAYASAASSSPLAIGDNADAIGNFTVALGRLALATDNYAIAIGNSSQAPGGWGIAIGNGANTGANDNALALGRSATATGINSTAIGFNASTATNNRIEMGNSSITSFRCQVALTVVSDRRAKENITPLTEGLDFVTKLQPVSFVLKNDENKTTRFGFIAQDVETVLERPCNLVIPPATDDGDSYHMTQEELIPVLVNAIHELQHEIQQLKSV